MDKARRVGRDRPRGPRRSRGKRDLARLAELAGAHDEKPLAVIEIVAVEADRLAHPKAARGKKSDERGEGRDAKREAEDVSCLDERCDLLVGVEVGRRPPPTLGQKIGRRHLVRGIERVQIGGKPPHDREPLAPPAGAFSFRRGRPGDGDLDRDPLLAALLDVGEKLGKELLGRLEPVPERAPQGEVVGERRAQGTMRSSPLPPSISPTTTLRACTS